jgi:hypothetical protein
MGTSPIELFRGSTFGGTCPVTASLPRVAIVITSYLIYEHAYPKTQHSDDLPGSAVTAEDAPDALNLYDNSPYTGRALG